MNLWLQGNDKKFLNGLVNAFKVGFQSSQDMLLLKNGYSVIFFPSRRQSARGFVRERDCRQKVEYFSSRALNIVLNIFSLRTNSAPAILAENGFADHTVEVPTGQWDSTAGWSLPLGL